MMSEASGVTRLSSYCPVSAMRLGWATSGGFLICVSSMEEVGLILLSFIFKCHDLKENNHTWKKMEKNQQFWGNIILLNTTGYCGRLRLLTRGQLTDPPLNSVQQNHSNL